MAQQQQTLDDVTSTDIDSPTLQDEMGHEAMLRKSDISTKPPTITDGIPDRVLSVLIRADWGHFRRIDRTVTKQSYRIIPRTTVAGLLAAIVGAPRDSYYQTFGLDVSSIAITPAGGIRTQTMSTLGVWTNFGERTRSAGASGRSNSATVKWPPTTTDRQRHPYEFLVDPVYRLDIAVEDPDFYCGLAAHLAAGKAHYTPSMGLSECLATVTFLGENDVQQDLQDDDGRLSVASICPGSVDQTVPRSGVSYHVERTPKSMQHRAGGRTTESFADYVYTTIEAPDDNEQFVAPNHRDIEITANAPVIVEREDTNAPLGQINDRVVAFL
jgi:CRISPR-associated protein Cas5h